MTKKEYSEKKKKESIKSEEDSFENDLDKIDSFSEEDFNFDIDAEFGKPREPSKVELAKEFTKSGATDFASTLVKKTSEKLLPQEYQTSYFELSDTFRSVKYELDTGLESLKRNIVPLFNILNKVLPKHLKFIDNFIERYSESEIRQKTEKELQEEQIRDTLTSVFEKQIVENRINESKKDAIESTKISISKLNQETLTRIDNSITELTNFNLTIAKEYYRKSLEFQLRSYFVQKEHLEEFKKYAKSTVVHFDSIVKNTSLPEIVKITNFEKLEDVVKSQIARSVYGSFVGKGSYLDTVKKRLVERVRGFFEDKLYNLNNLSSQLENLLSMTDTGFTSKASVASGIGGGILGSTIAGKITEKLKPEDIEKFQSNAALQSGRLAISGFLKSPSIYLNKLQNKLREKQSDAEVQGGPLGWVKNKAYSLGSNLIDIIQPNTAQTSNIEKETLIDYKAPVAFDKKAHRSLTEVIPLYLAKILKENTLLRTTYQEVNKAKLKGKEISVNELHYNPIERKLQTKEEVLGSIEEDILKGRATNRVSKTVEVFKSRLPNSKFREEVAKSDTQSLLIKYLRLLEQKGLEPKDLEEAYNYSQKDPQLKEFIQNNLKLKKLFDSYEKLAQEEKERINKAFSYSKKLSQEYYPVTAVEEFVKFLEEYSNKAISYDSEMIYAIAKGFSHFYYQQKTPIDLENIANLRAFSYVEKKEVKNLTNLIGFMSTQSEVVNEVADYASKLKALYLLSIINESIESKMDVPSNVFKMLQEFNPDIKRLSPTNIFEQKFTRTIQEEYVDSDTLYSIKSAYRKSNDKIVPISTRNFKEDLASLVKSSAEIGKATFKVIGEDSRALFSKVKKQVIHYYRELDTKFTNLKNNFDSLYKEATEFSDNKIDQLIFMSENLFDRSVKEIDEMIKDIQKASDEELNNLLSKVSDRSKEEISEAIKKKTKYSVIKLDLLKKTVKETKDNLKAKLVVENEVDRKKTIYLNTLKEFRDRVKEILSLSEEELLNEE